MLAVTIHNDFRAQENQICHCFYFFPFYLLWTDETRCHSFVSLFSFNVEFQASFSSVQFICSTMTDSLWPHGLQHAGLPCPSLTPRACSNSCPSSQWYHPTISSSVIPFCSCFQSFPASGSFAMISSLHQVAKVLELQLQHQSFQWMFRNDFLYDGLVGSPSSPRDSPESSSIPQFKSINLNLNTI